MGNVCTMNDLSRNRTGWELEGKGLYHGIYRAQVEGALRACEAVKNMPHQGEKGRIREILIGKLFRPLLPADLGVGTGFVIASTGEISSQQDIILYDQSVLPPAMVDEATGLFPIESVLYTIEVKTKLTREELRKTERSARKIAEFPILGKDCKPTKNEHSPRAVFLAFDTDLGKKKETVRYDEVRGAEEPSISAFCVLTRGYWFWGKNGWTTWPEKEGASRLVALVGGIMNTLPDFAETYRSRRPRLGRYLIDYAADPQKELQRIAAKENQDIASIRVDLKRIAQKYEYDSVLKKIFDQSFAKLDEFETQSKKN